MPAPKLLSFKRVERPTALPSVWQLSRQTLQLLWQQRWLFLGIMAVYALLNVIFAGGLKSGTDLNSLKQEVANAIGGSAGQTAASLLVFATLLGSSGPSPSTVFGVYQVFFGLIISLAIIWALRQVSAGERVRLKEPFYKGMYPLVPFILVLVVVLLQTVPFLIGGLLYKLLVSSGILSVFAEQVVVGLIFLALSLVSAYMLTASLFALYIVTLPDMTPLQALRSARKLVHYRRAVVFRKLLFLPLALLVATAAVLFPVIWLVTPAAEAVFFIVALLALLITHAYMYTLYRELLV